MQPLFQELLAIHPHLPDWWAIMWQEGWIICLHQGSTDWVCLPFYSNILSELLKKENDECLTERWEDGSLIDSQRTNVCRSSAILPHTPSLSPLCFAHFPFPLFMFSCVKSSLEPRLSCWQPCISFFSFFSVRLFFLLLDVSICLSLHF